MSDNIKLRAPKGLSEQSKDTWKRILSTHILSADGLLVLEGALREFDYYIQSAPGTDGRSTAYRNFLASLRYLGLSAGEVDA